MVNNTIHATYMETYDINTIQNELSILAVHTPQSNVLKKFFHGLYEQYAKMKVLGCNFSIQCASKQDLDPTLVGFENGQIDPRDVMNPILFKACTGEGINALLDQIYNSGLAEVVPSKTGHSIDQHLDANNALDAYYSLLADGSFRQAHPQRGMVVQGLKPMVHKVVTTQPFKWSASGTASGNPVPQIAGNPTTPGQNVTGIAGFGGQSGATDGSDPINPTVFVSNGVTEMPWLDTAYSKMHTYENGSGQTSGSVKAYSLQANIPRVYMGLLVLPPSSGAQNLYFRITVVWHILFKDFRFSQDLLPVSAPEGIDTDAEPVHDGGSLSEKNGYFNMYHTATKLQKDVGSFDTQGVESIECIMEKGQ